MQRILDRQEINDLLVRFWDTGSSHAREIFTEDGIDEHRTPPKPTILHGWDEMERFSEVTAPYIERAMHFVSNVAIEVDGDAASASWYGMVWHWLVATSDRGYSRPADVMGLGEVRDRLVRTPAGWRVAHRVLEYKGIGVGGFPESAGVTVIDP